MSITFPLQHAVLSALFDITTVLSVLSPVFGPVCTLDPVAYRSLAL